MKNKNILFQTRRLLVRPLEWSDFPAFFAMQSNPKTHLYLGSPVDDEASARAGLQRSMDAYTRPDNDWWVWAIERKTDGAMIGTCAIVNGHCPVVGSGPEIGYRFLEKYWGRGYASEVCDPLIDYALHTMRLPSVFGQADVQNVASIKVLEQSQLVFLEEFVDEKEKCTGRVYRLTGNLDAADRTEYPAVVDVWEASVRATHHFLQEEDIQYFKPLILNHYLDAVDLTVIRNPDQQIIGFLGVAEENLEMLFIHPDYRGTGIGKRLLRHAVDRLGIRKVDVNEQNEQAAGFYHHLGFETVGRSERDPSGKPYPILHLALRPPGQNLPALVLIDIQKGLDEWEYYGGRRNNPQAEKNAASLLHFWRENNGSVFHVRHNSTNPHSPLLPGKPGNEIKDIVKPVEDEPVFEKDVNSAFIGTGLQAILDRQRTDQLVIVGLTTEHCISSSVRMAANLGFAVTVVSDATAAFDKTGVNGQKYPAELVHEITLANLQNEFATVMGTAELLEKMRNLVRSNI